MLGRVHFALALLVTAITCVGITGASGAANAATTTFPSSPRQAAPLSVTGSNVVVADKSWVGFGTRTCLTVHDARNVSIHDVEFDGCGGDIFLVNVTGTVNIENVRARNTGDGTIGAGHGNVIQFNNVWQSAPSYPKAGRASARSSRTAVTPRTRSRCSDRVASTLRTRS